MADKRKYNSKMNAKGLEKSVSEEQARHMATHQGHTYTFIVQAHAGPKTVDEDGSEVVSLIPDLIEIVPREHEDRVHTFQRALYLARPEQYGQEAFEGAAGAEVPLGTAAAHLDAGVETDEKGEPTGVWDGDPDAPLEAAGETCDYPGCGQAAEHDGDHDDPAGNAGNGATVSPFQAPKKAAGKRG